MLYQISSGQGPAECELGVSKFLAWLQRHYQVEVLDCSAGYNEGTYLSVRFVSPQDLSAYVGSIQWICRSPYRPAHRRKNWFLDFQICAEEPAAADFQAEKVIYTTFHCGGKGGQNVNKVASGVRSVYPPTGDVVECTEERSQYANKQKALNRLREMFAQRKSRQQAAVKNSNWRCHTRLERGNAQRVFRGLNFE